MGPGSGWFQAGRHQRRLSRPHHSRSLRRHECGSGALAAAIKLARSMEKWAFVRESLLSLGAVMLQEAFPAGLPCVNAHYKKPLDVNCSQSYVIQYDLTTTIVQVHSVVAPKTGRLDWAVLSVEAVAPVAAPAQLQRGDLSLPVGPALPVQRPPDWEVGKRVPDAVSQRRGPKVNLKAERRKGNTTLTSPPDLLPWFLESFVPNY
ncbi:hypothetical protein NDU88_005189 [Pleurodeles waltl]|uniref:Uncharacterized protein n=1 Tax=Pleurodeles waltl TaxID=8319 RepID=A0AAV7VIA8_PLEWA|nr:hypothetical protein NDU88_005189 [Pleurodeles waltl]